MFGSKKGEEPFYFTLEKEGEPHLDADVLSEAAFSLSSRKRKRGRFTSLRKCTWC